MQNILLHYLSKNSHKDVRGKFIIILGAIKLEMTIFRK